MASVICAVPVFASASDEGASSSSNNGITTIYNRTFDDGWDAGNGGYFAGNSGVHYCGLAEEPAATGINRYMSMTLVSSLSGGCYYQMNVPTGTVGASDEHIMEFDIRSDGMSGPNTLSLLYARIGPNSSDDVTILRRTPDNKFQFVFGTTVNIATKLPSEWMHIGLKFSVDRAKGTLTVSCYADGVYIASGTITRASLIPTLFRFQVVSTGGDAGDNISFDNIKYYVGTSEFTELAEDDYGVLVNTSLGKTLSS